VSDNSAVLSFERSKASCSALYPRSTQTGRLDT